MTLPTATDYDQPHVPHDYCEICHGNHEGAILDGKWICDWCIEEIEHIKWVDEQEEEE